MYGLSIRKIVCTVYFWLMAFAGVISAFVVCLISYPFVNQKTFARTYEYVLCNFLLSVMSLTNIWSLKITDLRKPENKHFRGRYVVIANHASFIDTLVVGTLPLKKKFIMAKIFTNIPIFGWLCRTSGHVLVDENDKSTTKPAVIKAVETMKDGCSLFVYPEGKRSSDPYKLLPFKTGAFRIAQETELPILPLVIKGTGVGMKMWGICKPANLELIIGDPFPVKRTDNDEENWENIIKSQTKAKKFIEKHLLDRNIMNKSKKHTSL